MNILVTSIKVLFLSASTNVTPENVDIRRFDKESLLNPQSPDFWREGSHIPDEAYLQFAMNPTLENARTVILRGEIKAKRIQKMYALLKRANIELIQEGLVEDRYNIYKNATKQIKSYNKKIKLDKNVVKDLNYYFIFSKHCRHCEKQAKILINFKSNTYPLQVEIKEKLKHFNGLKKSTYASLETLQAYVPKRKVPVLIISNPKTNHYVKLEGVNSEKEILLESASLMATVESKGDKK